MGPKEGSLWLFGKGCNKYINNEYHWVSILYLKLGADCEYHFDDW